MKPKTRAIAALRDLRFSSNLWATFAKWKEQGVFPEQFKALIIGPHKTFKTQIGQWLQQLWPQAKFVERATPVGLELEALPLRFEEYAGYPLIIRTYRAQRIVGNTATRWEYATIPQCRWAATDATKHYDIVPRLRTT